MEKRITDGKGENGDRICSVGKGDGTEEKGNEGEKEAAAVKGAAGKVTGVERYLPFEVVELMEKLDSTTYNHSARVWELAVGMEEWLRMGDGILSAASYVHDIGKYYISTSILDKREGLSDLEREIIDLHPYFGYRVLDGFGVGEEIRRIVLYHHGMRPMTLRHLPSYPGSVKESAWMVQTLDMYEALTTDRPYKRGISADQACAYMEMGGYHPEVLRYLQMECEKDFDRRGLESGGNNATMNLFGYSTNSVC